MLVTFLIAVPVGFILPVWLVVWGNQTLDDPWATRNDQMFRLVNEPEPL